jgi:TolA-binding protein
MKIFKMIGLSSALCLSAMALSAQETSEVEQLRKQLQQMQESFDKVQREQKQQLDLLMKQIETLQKNQTTVSAEQEKLKQEMARPIAEVAPSTVPTGKKTVVAVRSDSTVWFGTKLPQHFLQWTVHGGNFHSQ